MNEKKWLNTQTVTNWLIVVFTAMLTVIACQQYRWVKSSERPWVGAISRGVAHGESQRVLRFEWIYANGGKTTARNIRAHLGLKVGDPIPGNPREIRAPMLDQCRDMPILPGTDGPIAMPGVPNDYVELASPGIANSSDSINRNALGLYFVGCLDYEDAMGNHYRTWVCEYYRPEFKRFGTCLSGDTAH